MKRLLIFVVTLGSVPLVCQESVQAKRRELLPPEPSIRNADLHPIGDSHDLQHDFAALADRVHDHAWVGYVVPMVSGIRQFCCGPCDAGHGVCHLETGDRNSSNSQDDDQATGESLVLMYRLAEGQVGKIRTFSQDCELDAGGLPIYWWSTVDPRQSMDLLQTQVRQQRSARMAESALQAIAHHAEPGANDLLVNFAFDRREDVAKQAIFWLGAVRGEGGLDSLKRITRAIENPHLREQITFALYLSKASEALAELVDMARNDKNSHVRGQALFWLSQKAGEAAATALNEAVEKDPDLDVKKKAVFGLSQLPPDQGVPLLIKVAETHRHSQVRKQAMFWLGQSGDQRALAFFEKILLEK